MAKPFDAALKDLIRYHPADWLERVGVPVTGPPEVLDAELSAVTAAADTLIRVGKQVVHIEVESGPDESLAPRMLLYNTLAHRRTGLPVRSVAVLLRSNAAAGNLTGRVEYDGLSFRFDVIRVWELPAADLLAAGVGLLPLAVLGKPAPGLSREETLPGNVGRILERVSRETPAEAGRLMTAAYILAGMHVAPKVVRAVFQKVYAMHESGTYQLILEEGAIAQTQKLILQMGRTRLGEPTDKQAAKLKAIEDLERLERMALRVSDAKSWDGLLRVK